MGAPVAATTQPTQLAAPQSAPTISSNPFGLHLLEKPKTVASPTNAQCRTPQRAGLNMSRSSDMSMSMLTPSRTPFASAPRSAARIHSSRYNYNNSSTPQSVANVSMSHTPRTPFSNALTVSDAFVPRRNLRRMGEVQAPEIIEIRRSEAAEEDERREKENKPNSNTQKPKELLPRSTPFTNGGSSPLLWKHKKKGSSAKKKAHKPVFLLSDEYYTVPSMRELQDMSVDELACIQGFVIGHDRFGELQYQEEIDCRGLVLNSDIVRFAESSLEIYPKEDDKPPVGEGLNKAARVMLKGCWPINRASGKHEPTQDKKLLHRYEKKLRKFCSSDIPIQFQSYDSNNGHWTFSALHF